MMSGSRTIIKSNTITHIIDSRTVALHLMLHGYFFISLIIPVIFRIIIYGQVTGIYQRKITRQLGSKLIIPSQSSGQVSPLHIEIGTVPFLTYLSSFIKYLAYPALEQVTSGIHGKRKFTPCRKPMGNLTVDIVKSVTGLDFIVGRSMAGNQQGRSSEQVCPTSPHTETERRFILDYRSFPLYSSIQKSQRKNAVIRLHIPLFRTDIDNRRESASIACRESAFIEINILHHIRMER